MYTATEVTSRMAHLADEGMSKPDQIRYLAQDCLGWSYVYAAAGCMCTPDNRRHYAAGVKDKYPKYYNMIIDNCPILSNAKDTDCRFCKWHDTRCFDCRGFTRWVMEQVGIQIFGGGATTQYDTNSNWVLKGPISEMPRNIVCCIFKKDGSKMSHTGLYLGDDKIIHCSGTVKNDKLSETKSWTHYGVPSGLYSDKELAKFGINVSDGKNIPTLRKGANGGDVRKLQNLLNALGFGILEVDGLFGAKTEEAVKAFQSKNNLTADGIVGKKTWAVLDQYDPIVHEDADQVDIDNVENAWEILYGLFSNEVGPNPVAVAGILGNLMAESGINPKNLEGKGNQILGLTDDEYTNAVDNGTITRSQFASDGYGYGICQWTYKTRKEALWDFANYVFDSVSIGNLEMQMLFLMKELGNIPKLKEKLKNARTVFEASSAFMLEFEKPANISEENQEARADIGQEIYDRYGIKEKNPIENLVQTAYMIPAEDVQKLRNAAQLILDTLKIYQS